MYYLEYLKSLYLSFSEIQQHFFQITVTVLSFCIIPWLVRTALTRFLDFRANKERKGYERKFIHRAQYFVGFVFSIFWFKYFDAYGWYSKLAEVGAVIFAVLMLHSVLDFLEVRFNGRQGSNEIPIKPFAEIIKLASFAMMLMIIIVILLEISPMAFISGIGAMSAIVLLLFKDSILGTVTAVKINVHRLVKKGDWIEVDSYGADGVIKDITLSVITVENWDKTTSIIPTYEILNVGLKNWRSMTVQGRRIKRDVAIDVNSIKFLDMDKVKALSQVPLISDQIHDLCAKHQLKVSGDNISKRCLTNAGLFRLYVEAYLRSRHDINQEMTLMARQLASTAKGVPLEVYCFTKNTDWNHFESVQAEIFEHLYSVLHIFELRAYQNLMGNYQHSLQK
ncbi:mechanosensitive ion channel protein MscS [Photobacterium rosenbergii]|uniref:Mechanosensitive ion channel protein MscS n=2 Tax=Photobacterium rosenbergii TaxID=294936 RepID=A0A2T3MZB1_9GAMM|nr:mechanosensitive ion channel protein MscS [Photobacterium rosenbergii]